MLDYTLNVSMSLFAELRSRDLLERIAGADGKVRAFYRGARIQAVACSIRDLNTLIAQTEAAQSMRKD